MAIPDIVREYTITATVQTIMVPIGDEGQGQTLVNDGTSDIFFRKVNATLTPAGTAAVLVADPFFCNKLKPTENTKKAGTILQVACATGETSTLRMVDGMMDQDDAAANAAATGYDPNATFTRVNIDQTAASGVTVLIAALAGSYTRLHALYGTVVSQGTLTLEDSDGTDIHGPILFGAGGGINLEFVRDKDGVPVSLIGKGMSINTTSKFIGHAIVSQSTTV